jgi:hypothetical protein
LSLVIGIIRMVLKQPWPTPVQFFALLGLVSQIGAMYFFSRSGSLRQWTLFNTVMVWLVGLFLIVPDSSEASATNRG